MFDKITGLEEKLIDHITNKYPHAVEEARAYFLKDDETVTGFSDWLCYGHKIDGMSSALSLYEGDELEILKQSRFSFYEIVKEETGLYFKDIFTNDVFKMDPDTKIGDVIVSCRIYKVEGLYYYLENGMTFDVSSKDFLVKGMFEKYNQSIAGNQISLEDFIDNNLHLLLKLSSILFDIELEEDDEAMTVHVCTYGFQDRKSVIKSMESIEDIKLVEEDMDLIYTFTRENAIIAEVVLMQNTLEVECNSMNDIEYVKEVFEDVDSLTFMKVETLGLDDLI